jgi:hypothetical protein
MSTKFVQFSDARNLNSFLNPTFYNTHESKHKFDNGTQIPFHLIFNTPKNPDTFQTFWVSKAVENLRNLLSYQARKLGKFIKKWLLLNQVNGFLAQKYVDELISSIFVGTKASSATLWKVKFPHPRFNNFQKGGCYSLKQPIVRNRKIIEHQQNHSLPVSNKHDLFSTSAFGTCVPIFEKKYVHNRETYYRLHPVWILFIKYNIFIGQPIAGYEFIQRADHLFTPQSTLISNSRITNFYTLQNNQPLNPFNTQSNQSLNSPKTQSNQPLNLFNTQSNQSLNLFNTQNDQSFKFFNAQNDQSLSLSNTQNNQSLSLTNAQINQQLDLLLANTIEPSQSLDFVQLDQDTKVCEPSL